MVDMPFGSYQGNSKMAVSNAIRIMKESEADAVKIEGGMEILESVERILSSGIPVMGHLGLTPQSIHKFGTYAPSCCRTRSPWRTQAASRWYWRRYRRLWARKWQRP